MLIENPCVICSKRKGDLYQFYYGKKISEYSSSINSDNTYTKTTNYKIYGNREVVICYECIEEKNIAIRKKNIIFGLILLIIGIIVMFICISIFESIGRISASDFVGMVGLVLGFSGVALIVASLSLIFGNSEQDGDSIAIAYKSDDLTKAGYDAFFTRKGYKSLIF